MGLCVGALYAGETMSRQPASAEYARSLSSRDREILRDTISAFILRGEPVSSRLVAKMSRESLSSATIRNVMADLEDSGLLTQPHTSAGRIPTAAGYHLYIDALMPSRGLERDERRQIDELLDDGDPEGMMVSASQLLSELTHQIGIVLTPDVGETRLRAISFVQLTGAKVLCVLVSTGGFVDNKVVETGREHSREELIRISNYLTDNFAGRTMREVRDLLLESMSEERAKVDRLLGNAIELAERALVDTPEPELLVQGTATVLDLPELADLERVRRLLDTFSDHASVVQMLNRLIEGPGVRVLIGGDSQLTSKLDFSLVAKTYGGEGGRGTLAIFGPSRMEYQKVIPLVDYLGERLSLALEQAFTGGCSAEEGSR